MSPTSHGFSSRSSRSPASGASSPTLDVGASSSSTRTRGLSHRIDQDESQSQQRGLGLEEGVFNLPNGHVGIDGGSTRRRRHHNSGGFLLNDSNEAAKYEVAKDGRVTGSGTTKSKGKSKNTEYLSTSWHGRHASHKQRPSIGRSPLSVEVRDSAGEGDGHHVPVSNDARSSPSSARENDATSTELPDSTQRFDTNPTQIVNLALDLSESRRRNASIGRSSALDNFGSRRIYSAVQPGMPLPYSPAVGSSMRHHMSQRKSPRPRSPRSEKARNSAPKGYSPRSALGFSEQATSRTIIPGADISAIEQTNFVPSDATLARAEKARLWLGLFYQYRRLLQYLPPLPSEQASRPGTAKDKVKSVNPDQLSLGRRYNPLQYRRNRKIRGRLAEPEEDSWKDHEKVRGWVDTIAGEREDGVFSIDDPYPLPQFSAKDEDLTLIDSPPTPVSRGHQPPVTTKTPRAKVDWTITPWDMLADVYWMHSGDNKSLMVDRDDVKIYPSPPAVDRVQAERLESRRSMSKSRSLHRRDSSFAAEKPSREDLGRERGRRKHQLRDSISHTHEYSCSRDRKGKWAHKLIRSQSQSSADESTTGSVKGLKNVRERHNSSDRQDSVLLDKQLRELLAKEAKDAQPDSGWRRDEALKPGFEFEQATFSSRRPSEKGFKAGDPLLLDTESDKQKLNPERRRDVSGWKTPNTPRRSPYTSLEDLSSTATNSPMNKSYVPSIAINLTPPRGRSTARDVHQGAEPGVPDRTSKLTRNLDHSRIEGKDFATSKQEDHASTSNAPERKLEKAATVFDGYLSPKSAESFGRLHHRRSDSKSVKAEKDPKEAESKLRGLIRGSRLAELVTNPVNKVGELIWRKESGDRSVFSPPASGYASEASETDDEALPGKWPRAGRVSQLDEHSSGITGPRQGTFGEPKYHMNNLPVFKSPFKRDSGDKASATKPESGGYGQSQQNEVLSPAKRARLAPLNTRLSSPSPSVGSGRKAQIDSGKEDVPETQRAERRFAVVHGSPDQHGRTRPVTGKDNPNALRTDSSGRPYLEGNRFWSITNRELTPFCGPITAKDVVRVRTVLLSAGIKANEMSLRFIERGATHELGNERKRLARLSEHTETARLVVEDIEAQNSKLRETADKLFNVTVNNLHDRIRAIDDHITKDLTSLVRVSADSADKLGTELSTSRMLDVKRLNDNIDLILRRRRRRLRWLRMGGYLLLEWTLLALMWWVWLIVMMIRLVRGLISGVYHGVRWLLWLE